ncbi:MAG: flagellar hook protein FlgE [Acidobacteriota bacterium]|nr:flagellar hook protein FlgE [Acidobacteriota bacterium]
MGNFSIALSGLEANSVALNTIGNNLANLNTTAYKGRTTAFEDLFYQQIGESGSGDAIQVGAGTKVSGTSTNFTEGTILPDATANSSDMALAGNGFFVVNQSGVQSLTRAGNFQLSSNGNLITQDGQQVMGYAAVNGVVNQNSSLTPITIPVGVNQGAQATQDISLTANLNSNATVGTAFSSPVQVYDSLGQSHQISVSYTKTGTNTWSYSVALPAGDATGVPSNNTGTLTFDSSGKLVSPAGTVSNITFPGLTDGASDLSFNWNLNNTAGTPTISQLASASTNTGSYQDGFNSGVYQSFTADANGIITAQFSNGRTSTIGQIAVATVANTAGLIASGGNNYNTSAASGAASIGVAGAGGRGTIDDGALEQSNVNISTEFSNLIVAQRAFEANSKTITTFDTVSQDVLSMIR